MKLSARWGARQGEVAGADRASFLEGGDVKDLPPWNHVHILSFKEDTTVKGKPMCYVMYRQAQNMWVHRQAYFSSSQLYKLLKLFDIHDGIEDGDEIRGKELWVQFDVEKTKKSDRVFPKIVAYSLDDPNGRNGNVPF